MLSKCSSDLADLGQLAPACAGEEDIDLALFLLDGVVQAVEVGETCCVSLHAGDIFADGFDGLIQLVLPAAGDEDVCAFFNEELGCGQCHA